MAYINQFNLANTQTFKARVMIALITACVAVMAEDPTTPNHADRVIYANKALMNPQAQTLNASIAVCTGFITPTSTDSDIQFTINAMFDALAG